MYVTDHGHRCTNVHDVGFSHEDLLCLFANFAQESFVEQLFVKELLDACIEIEGSHGAI
jgi:hypothetical protein